MIIIKGLSLPKYHMELVIYSNGDVAVFDREAGAFKRSYQELKIKAAEVGWKNSMNWRHGKNGRNSKIDKTN